MSPMRKWVPVRMEPEDMDVAWPDHEARFKAHMLLAAQWFNSDDPVEKSRGDAELTLMARTLAAAQSDHFLHLMGARGARDRPHPKREELLGVMRSYRAKHPNASCRQFLNAALAGLIYGLRATATDRPARVEFVFESGADWRIGNSTINDAWRKISKLKA